MAVSSASIPAFGQADLSNCEQEQIQLAGSIQPHGALLVVREPDQVIVQASANASEFLCLDGDVLGRSIEDLGGDLSERVRPHLKEQLDTIPVAVRCRVGHPPRAFDGQLHRPADGGLVIELERAGPAVDVWGQTTALKAVLAASSIRALCDETAVIFKKLTGYDRVMVYRFDDDGHGEVFSEQREDELEPYLGNHYPASDIPQIARRLYERNRVRVLVDVEYAPVPLRPRLSPITGEDLDMSLCFLRSMSPIHIQYLKNMGVGATLVVSLMVGGRLWGLVACHHYAPRVMPYACRAVCELLAETIATRIAALESFEQAHAALSVRRLEQRMIEAISREGDWRAALFDNSQALLQPVNATGAALLFEDQILTTGDVPGTHRLREIGEWLAAQPPSPVTTTASLGIDEPRFASVGSIASGLLATPASNSPGDYLIWFRPERVRKVTWGGNPFKPVIVGDDPSDLSPRRSFSQWHQLVEGTSDAWTAADLTAARLIGNTVVDVVLQFRAVRLLIAKDQLDLISRQVQHSEHPVVIADPDGSVLMTNESFGRLVATGRNHVRRIEDLPSLFREPAEVRRRLKQLLEHRRVWRGEVLLAAEPDESKPFLVRADPVFSSPDRVLGFVLLFTDLSQRKAVENARSRFQERIIQRDRVMAVQLGPEGDVVYQSLLSSVLDNAQLAALEITDGLDTPRTPEMLESVRASVSRTAELLEHLVWHATSESERQSDADDTPEET